MNPIHMPGTIYAYGHTSSRLFGINNARLISRTPQEAAYNLAKLNVLRSWTMPYFGQAKDELIGQPPDVLGFWAYALGPSGAAVSGAEGDAPLQSGENDGDIKRMRATHIHNVPTVIHNLQITYPSDIDYIPTAADEFTFGSGTHVFTVKIDAGIPMPTIMTSDIQLYETHSPSEFNKFDLRQYRTGNLDQF